MYSSRYELLNLSKHFHESYFYLVYGKSDLFQATKDSIINLLCIRQSLGVYARSNNRKAKTNIQMPDLNAFADEVKLS